jgi:hypothetical protein
MSRIRRHDVTSICHRMDYSWIRMQELNYMTWNMWQNCQVLRCLAIYRKAYCANVTAKRFPFSGSMIKMRFTQKIPHADTPLVSFYAILCHPRAIVIASRLHYLILLLRTIPSHNISIEYWHQYQSQQCQPCHRSCCTLHAGHASLYYKQSIGQGMGMSLRNLFSYRTTRPPAPSPMHPSAAAPNAETPPPIKTRIFYVNKNLLTDVLSLSVLCSVSLLTWVDGILES